MTGALVLRVVVGCAALGLLAFGVTARLPRHRRLVNQSSRILLVGALVLWGAAVLSNAIQILWYALA
jgi:hypothetical protein